MSILAIVPVKEVSQAKSRLSHLINDEQRELLTFELLKRTLNILKSAHSIDDILVISRDMRVHSVVEAERVFSLQEQGTGLNHALEQATAWSANHGYSALLVVPLDLPFLTVDDINAIAMMGTSEGEVVVVAPDCEMRGTNALFIKPPGIVAYRFGRNSYQSHVKQSTKKGIETKTYYSFGTGFDVDSPTQYSTMLQGQIPEFMLCRRP